MRPVSDPLHEPALSELPRVLHLSTTLEGGAGLAAFRLHEALSSAGNDSAIWSRHAYPEQKDAPGVSIVRGRPFDRVMSSIYSEANRRLHRGAMPAFSPLSHNLLSDTELLASSRDVYHFHNFYNFADLRSLIGVVSQGAAAVVTMHDERWYTGGCHYAAGCSAYSVRCGSCPQCANSARLLPTLRQRRDRGLLESSRWVWSRVRFVSPSVWLANRARKSTLLSGLEVSRVPNCVPEVFFRQERLVKWPCEELRVAWIPPKGREFLVAVLEALSQMEGPKVRVLVPGSSDVEFSSGRVSVSKVDQLLTEGQRARFFASCHITLMTTEIDNFPNISIESLAVGTPVIVSPAGGAHEAVVETGGGWIMERNPRVIAAALSGNIPSGELQEKMQLARKGSLERFSPEVVAAQYNEVYRRVLVEGVTT